MKFKLLEESFDDDVLLFEDDHSLENVPEGPTAGADTGVAGELIHLINDEWEAIEGYNNAIATLRSLTAENPFYTDAIKVLEEISNEENVHIGQLQELLKRISPNASSIEEGEKEAQSQLGFKNGVLPVQSWDVQGNEPSCENNTNENSICSITDVDDEF